MNLNRTANTIIAELKANPRLRWGLWAILGILWLYGVLELRDETQRKGETYLALNKKVAKLKTTAMQTEWHARQTEARALQLNLETRLWRENTIGLAQATFHDWLSQQTQQANLGKAQLVVAAKDDEGSTATDKTGTDGGGTRAESNLWKVSAKLTFDFNPQSFYPWLTRITMNEKKIAVESLTIRSTPSPKADVLLVAYYLKPAPDVPKETDSGSAQKNDTQ